ncbi:uncharacterized protein LOC136033302 [Artemia franciscana]|uniref:Uncharacterized protein n=1 Tax=Artemia franciscana TaxID=6661 RepID=A0AA88I6E0_ARTSF|nr:hypothetical protein QYM36_001431 [Artemia franciscana]
MMKIVSLFAFIHYSSATIRNGFQGGQPLGSIGVNSNTFQNGYPGGSGFPGMSMDFGRSMRPIVRPLKVELECVTSNVGRGVIRWVRQTGQAGSEIDVVAEGPTVFDMKRFNVVYTPLLDNWRSKLIINMVDPSLQHSIYMCQFPNPLPPYTLQSSEPFVVGGGQVSQMTPSGFSPMGNIPGAQSPAMFGGGNFGGGVNGVGAFNGFRSSRNEEGTSLEKAAVNEFDDSQASIDAQTHIEEKRKSEKMVVALNSELLLDEQKKKRENIKLPTDPDAPFFDDDGTVQPQFDDDKKKKRDNIILPSDPDYPFILDDGTIQPQFDEDKKKKRDNIILPSDPDYPFIHDDGTIQPQFDDDKKKRDNIMLPSDPDYPFIQDDGTIQPQFDDDKKKKRDNIILSSDPDAPFIHDDGTIEPQFDEDRKKKSVQTMEHYDPESPFLTDDGKIKYIEEKKKKDKIYNQSSRYIQTQTKLSPNNSQMYEYVASNHRFSMKDDSVPVEMGAEMRSPRKPRGVPIINEEMLGSQHDLGALDEDFPIYRNEEMPEDRRKRRNGGQPEFYTGLAKGTVHVLSKRG